MLTKVEFRDLLVRTSLEGKFPSVRKGRLVEEICAYRGSEGRKCVVGLLIPDEVYDEKMEGMSADSIKRELGIPVEDWLPQDVTFSDLVALQCIHDTEAASLRADRRPWNHEEFVTLINQVLGV